VPEGFLAAGVVREEAAYLAPRDSRDFRRSERGLRSGRRRSGADPLRVLRYGLDVSAETLDGAPDGLRAVVGRAEELSFPDHAFDAVIFVASLQFVDDYRQAVAEAWRDAQARRPDDPPCS
jgi:hypothetical protein